MGNAAATVEQMKAYLKAKNPNVAHRIFRTAPRDVLETRVNAGVLQRIRGGVGFQMLHLRPDAELRRAKGIPLYRVRKSWADASSQKGAFKSLENAKKCADENPGYSVFDESGKAVYTRTAGLA